MTTVPRDVVPARLPRTDHASHPGDGSAQIVPSDHDERTRDRVLTAVLQQGPVSAAELGDHLGFTPAAMRRHLDALSQEGLIEVKRARSSSTGAGRPARRYVLSQRGQTSMGTDYLGMAIAALAQLGDTAGAGAIEEFARARFSGMEERYRPFVDAAGPDLEARARALADALSADGFVGSTKTVGLPQARGRIGSASRPVMLSVQLCQGHCPIQGLASAFPAFCEQETDVFARLLGVDVRRLSTLAGGGHVCNTHIPLGRTVVPAEGATGPSGESAERPDQPVAESPCVPEKLSIHQQGRP